MTTGDTGLDALVVVIFVTAFLSVLVIPAALLEWLLGPEGPQ